MGYDFKNDYDFSDSNLITPDKVIQDICNEFNETTEGFVLGNVREYRGRIDSYNQISPVEAIANSLKGVTKVDVQNNLGPIGNELYFQYELFLSAKYIDNYKYRILFIGYNFSGYPVKIVLEQGIADDINKKEDSDYVVTINTRENLEDFILKILKCKKIKEIVQELITASLRKHKDRILDSEDRL